MHRRPALVSRRAPVRAFGRRLSLLLGALGIVAGAGCDPVHDDAVSALGPETPGLRKGPTHRPGEPCLTCHGGKGPGNPELSVAGTVYRNQLGLEALEGATVHLTGADGAQYHTVTNRTGNFLIEPGQWKPVYPMRTSVEVGGIVVEMKTHVGRAGSCADCHYDPPGVASVGHVYLVATPDAGVEAGP